MFCNLQRGLTLPDLYETFSAEDGYAGTLCLLGTAVDPLGLVGYLG